MRRIVGSIILAVAIFWDAPAKTEIKFPCFTREAMGKWLAEKYDESPMAVGIVGKNDFGLMEIFTSKTGSWSFVVTGSNGVSCLVATGKAFEMIPMGIKS